MMRRIRLPDMALTLRQIVPPLAGWGSYRRAWLNLLVFGLAVVGGEWLVHQAEYAIEYGSRFNAVMATTPHHLYMPEAGVTLALLGVSFTLMVACILQRA